jgi:hypothetical protein
MKRAILIAASLGLCVSAAGACDFQRSAKAEADQTVVASVATEAAPPAQSTMIRQEAKSE